MNKKQQSKYVYSLAVVVFFVAFGLIAWLGYQFITQPVRDGSFVTDFFDGKSKIKCDFRKTLNGECVDNEDETVSNVVAIMVENHPDARPQSGLVDASVVYEAPVEANYSRFLLLFPKDAEVKKVGPVRSARPYYLDWVSEYNDPMYMHVGGSPEALEKIKQIDLFDLNEFYRGWYYWRSKDRYAPHNVYTSEDHWNKAWEDYGEGRGTTTTESWAYNEMDACEDGCTEDITVTFLGETYQANWKFNTSTLQYDRYQGGVRHVDKDLRPIVADTIIVQHVTSTVVDAIGRLHIQTQGAGPVQVFRDGHRADGTWMKIGREQKTKWLNSEGEEIPIKPGKIWIEVINARGEVEYK